MAVETLIGVGVIVGGVDVSAWIKSVTVDDGYQEFDDTVMTHAAQSMRTGLPTPSIMLTFLQDYAASASHSVFRAAVNVATAVIVRKTAGAARSATNPEWQFTGKLLNYRPLDGQVGQFQVPSVTFRSAGTAMSYVTAST